MLLNLKSVWQPFVDCWAGWAILRARLHWTCGFGIVFENPCLAKLSILQFLEYLTEFMIIFLILHSNFEPISPRQVVVVDVLPTKISFKSREDVTGFALKCDFFTWLPLVCYSLLELVLAVGLVPAVPHFLV